MTLIGTYKKFKMWKADNGMIEFWHSDKSQSKIARIVTLKTSPGEAKIYFDQLAAKNVLNTFYS